MKVQGKMNLLELPNELLDDIFIRSNNLEAAIEFNNDYAAKQIWKRKQ
jgi:hypothetical protein